jgi:peptidoglycan hydrolase FlgJ
VDIKKTMFALKPTDPVELQKQQEGKLRDASKQYEDHFLNEMVKAMRSTVHRDGGLMQPNMAENIFSEQLDQKYVESWADKGGIGLADMIYNQLHERIFPVKKDFSKPQGPIPLEKTGPMQIKIEKTGEKNPMPIDGNAGKAGGQVTFRNEEGVPASAVPVQSPWDGKVESFSQADGWSHVSLRHANGLSSQLSYQGSLAALSIGEDVEAGEQVGTLPPASNSTLRWKINDVT